MLDSLNAGDFGASGKAAADEYRQTCAKFFRHATKFRNVEDNLHLNNNNHNNKNDHIEEDNKEETCEP